ncbi:MAG: hypothetical protein ABIC95_06200 [archaeon]
MNSFIAVLMIASILLLAGCGADSQNVLLPSGTSYALENLDVENFPPEKGEPGEVPTKIEKLYSPDCSLLDVEDILTVCGVEAVAREEEVPAGQACAKRFDAGQGRAVYLSYSAVGGDSKIQYSHCLRNLGGESVGDFACFAPRAGDTVYVYSKEHTIVLVNTVAIEDYWLCSADELKELGRIISGKIFI